MKKILFKPYQPAVAILFTLFLISCQKDLRGPGHPGGGNGDGGGGGSIPKELKDFVQVNLVSDDAIYSAAHLDANLKNGWGLAISSAGQVRVNAEAKSISGIYTLDGNIVSVPTYIPGSVTSDGGASRPTGHVYNTTSDFKLPNGYPAQFISASADGSLAGWNSGNTAVRMADNAPDASYVGVTIASDAGNNYLYAANFAANRIDVYDKNWVPVPRAFNDPTMPSEYSPFNIQTIDGKIYVTYAKKNSQTGEEETGNGKGYVSVFNADGSFVKRFASQGKLNAPWGITKAPTGFWGSSSQLSNMILVGNFGNGQINVFDQDGNYIGVLHSKGKAIEIDGLWGIAFPPSTSLNNTYLYFAAGPGTEEHGLLGYIKNLYIN